MSVSFHFERAWSMAVKEFRHVLRDPFTLLWALGMPLILVIFFGYAIDFNVRHVGLATSDRDLSRASRELLRVTGGSGYFDLKPMVAGQDPQTLLFEEKAKGVLIIEPDFGKRLGQGLT
ncbi:MAG: ABC transporter permease, partial [Candidatus Firestonebacteria bacterium]|nr:ABC transporter permease [Candidatus Firestonebacteria bacterium]